MADADATDSVTADAGNVLVADKIDAASKSDADDQGSARTGKRPTLRRVTVFLAVAVIIALTVLTVSTSMSLRSADSAARDQDAFLQAGRQGALNLTTIRWDNADSDVARILDGSTGAFHDDFASRSESFIAVVKQAQSTSEGTITEAGLESVDGDTAQVVVAATVKTSNLGGAEQDPRAWRIRLTVQKVDDRPLVSNVEFVP